MRHTRSAMLQVLCADYVRTARAKGLRERVVVLQARAAQRADPGHHAGRARVRHAAVGRRADRAGLHDPRLRQADRRRGVQPRLRGGAGRRAVSPRPTYIVLNLLADVAYVAGQPAAAGLAHGRRRAAPRRRRAAPSASPGAPRAGAGCCAASGAMFGLVVVVLFVAAGACSRRCIAPYDPIAHELDARSARRRRWRTGSAPTRSAATCCRASSGARAPRCWPASSRCSIALAHRRADRPAGGLCRRLDRRADLAHHRRDARLPVPDPGDRAGGVPRARASPTR